MKLSLLFSFAAASILLFAACGESNTTSVQTEEIVDNQLEKINWYKNYDEAMAAARSENKIVMIDVYTDWCHWCKELDKNVFAEKNMVAYSPNIIALKLDAEDNKKGTEIAKKYGVSGYPTILFIDANGEEVDRIGGYLPADKFLTEVKRIRSGEGTIGVLTKAYKEGKLTADQSFQLATKFLQRQNMEKAKELLASVEYEQLEEDDSKQGYLLNSFNLEYMEKNFAVAESRLVQFLQDFPKHELEPKVIYFLMMAQNDQGKKAEAKATLEKLKAEYPDEKEMINRAEAVVE